MKERVIVKGEAMWASLFERNEMSDRYQIDICNLDKDAIKALKSIDVEVKKGEGEKADKGYFVTAKTKRLPKEKRREVRKLQPPFVKPSRI